MTIYKDVNGREFTYSEYSKKVYLDEKRPHVDHLIRHKWPDEKPKPRTNVLIRKVCNGVFEVSWYDGEGWWTPGCTFPFNGDVHWWNLPEVTE